MDYETRVRKAHELMSDVDITYLVKINSIQNVKAFAQEEGYGKEFQVMLNEDLKYYKDADYRNKMQLQLQLDECEAQKRWAGRQYAKAKTRLCHWEMVYYAIRYNQLEEQIQSLVEQGATRTSEPSILKDGIV